MKFDPVIFFEEHVRMIQFGPETMMKDVEQSFPFARALLHSKFHVGGCATCGFEPNDTIQMVAQKHGKNESEMISVLTAGLKDMREAEIDVEVAARAMIDKSAVMVVDVREAWEFEICKLSDDAVLLTEKTMPLIFEQGASKQMVLVYCHHGARSLNATMYMRQNGLPNAVSLRGGIDKFSSRVNPNIPRY